MSDSQPFRFRHPVAVRFHDIDVYGHAHHSRALIYFEEARWAYWDHVVGTDRPEDVSYVLAEMRVRYHRRVRYPMSLDVGVRVSEVGRKHFGMIYEVRSSEGELLVSGSSVQVMIDYATERATSLPPDIRSAIDEWDGPFGGDTSAGRSAADR